MSDRVLREILRRLRFLEDKTVGLRKAEVTSASPLAITLAGSDTEQAATALGSSRPLVGDVVVVLTRGNNPPLVLGTITSGWSPDWQTPTFATGYADYGLTDPNLPAEYAISPLGEVKARGFASATSTWGTGGPVVTLPRAPSHHTPFLVPAFGSNVPGWAYVQARTNGEVRLLNTNTTWGSGANLIGLGGISFWAES